MQLRLARIASESRNLSGKTRTTTRAEIGRTKRYWLAVYCAVVGTDDKGLVENGESYNSY